MADETEIVKLKTIVNLKSQQAGFRAKKRCGRGESRVTEGRGVGTCGRGGKGGERNAEGGDAEGGKPACAGGRTATRVERGKRPGMHRLRGRRRGNAESHRTAAHPLPYVSSVPIPQNKSFRKGDGGAGEGEQPFFRQIVK